MEKDIPFLQSVMPKRFAAAYMKGRSNYLCLQRFHRSGDSPVLSGLEELDYFEEVSHWASETETGDRAELANLPESLSFWRQIDARSETCVRQKCPDFDPVSSPHASRPKARHCRRQSSPVLCRSALRDALMDVCC